jgi:hypothetical protein
VGHVYAGTYESHPVAIKKHKMDGSMMDSKALIEFEFEVRHFAFLIVTQPTQLIKYGKYDKNLFELHSLAALDFKYSLSSLCLALINPFT